MSGYWAKVIESDVDYSEYLGPDYKKKQVLPKKTSMIVANHTSWLDSPVLITSYYPGFTTSAEAGEVPVLNTLINTLQSVYVQRSAAADTRQSQLDSIIERQKLVEQDPRFNQLLIFPEGTQSNGAYLGNFKKGGFSSLLAVQPCVLKYQWDVVCPSWEGIPFVQHMIVMCC
jgi:1-acyl-sn-glycerol-3-phosphate acyltransferase